jgi:hypothetical protein
MRRFVNGSIFDDGMGAFGLGISIVVWGFA